MAQSCATRAIGHSANDGFLVALVLLYCSWRVIQSIGSRFLLIPNMHLALRYPFWVCKSTTMELAFTKDVATVCGLIKFYTHLAVSPSD